MNLYKIKNLLDDFYRPVEPIKDKLVIRCERPYEGIAYEVFYFDYSNQLKEIDITQHTKNLLAEEYYKNAGNLQWNYYLAFITEGHLDLQRKFEIENNDDFARKFVIPISDLDDWLKCSYRTFSKSQTQLEENLSDIWIKALNAKGLDFVYDVRVNITEGVERIISPVSSIKENKESKSARGKSNRYGDFHFLQKVELVNYRPFPKVESPIEFSKVNLIRGTNGAGKTSLLEAIEYLLTGSNMRSDSDDSYAIKAWCNSEGQQRISTTDIEILNARDQGWYKSVSKIRGNNLNQNFNRYNFFNSDAAFALSNTKGTIEGFEEAFAEVALGPEVTQLKSRMKKYIDALSPKRNAHESDLQHLRERIKYIKSLSEEKPISPPRKSFNEIESSLKMIGLKALFPSSIDEDFSSLKSVILKSKVLLEKVIEALYWNNDLSYESLKSEKATVEKLIKSVKDLETKIETEAIILDNFDWKVEVSKNEMEIWEQIKPYYDKNFELPILGLGERIRQLEIEKSRVDNAKKLFIKINLVVLSEMAPSKGKNNLIETEKIYHQRLQGQEKELQSKENEISLLQIAITDINRMRSEIKSLGEQLINHQPSLTKCPLCNYDYQSTSKLIEHINLKAVRTDSEKRLTDLLNELSVQKVKLNETKHIVNELSAFLEILGQLKFDALRRASLENAVDSIKNRLNTINVVTEDLNKAKLLKKQLSNLHMSEGQFLTLKNLLKSEFNQNLEEANIELIDSKIRRLRSEITTANQGIKKCKSTTKEIQIELNRVIRSYDSSLNREEISVELSQRLKTINRILRQFEHPKEYVFNKKLSFDSVLSNLLVLEVLVEDIVQYSDKKKSKELSTKKNQSELIRLNNLSSTTDAAFQRINAATKALKEILSLYSETKFLNEFLSNNQADIERIFLTLHAPTEFKGITISDGTIKLQRDDNKIASLNTISAGQRTAVALAMFLALNEKLKNGPDFLLFDDPIAFVDDLNILSFLDYLREIAIDTNQSRQIFFATANENLAFLFKKKFEFLGDDFKEIPLKRLPGL